MHQQPADDLAPAQESSWESSEQAERSFNKRKIPDSIRCQVLVATFEFGLELNRAAELFNISLSSVKTIRREHLHYIQQCAGPNHIDVLQQYARPDLRKATIKKIARAISKGAIPTAITKRLYN